MTTALPFSEIYNLGRLGQAGDTVVFAADDAVRAAIARWSEVEDVRRFAVTVRLTKSSATRFVLDFDLEAEVVQACVVTLVPLAGTVERHFVRELNFIGPPRRGERAESPPPPVSLDDAPEPPEDIESLHYDLAAPALEEFVLGLDPYPRAPGAEFAVPEEGADPRENPFAVLKALKSRT